MQNVHRKLNFQKSVRIPMTEGQMPQKFEWTSGFVRKSRCMKYSSKERSFLENIVSDLCELLGRRNVIVTTSGF